MGCGAIFIRRGVTIEPLFHGGSQDRGRRPGTENVAAAVGLAKAAELAISEREAEATRLSALRDRLQHALAERIPDLIVHGSGAPRAPHILNVSALSERRANRCSCGARPSGDRLLGRVRLSEWECYALACIERPLGVKPAIAGAAIRMSLGHLTTDAAIDRVAEVFPKLVAKARGLAANAA